MPDATDLAALAARMGLAKLQADHPEDFAEAAALAPKMVARVTRDLPLAAEPSLVMLAPVRAPRG